MAPLGSDATPILPAQYLRIRRKRVQAGDAVARHADDRRAGGVELLFVLSERVGFDVAAAGERGRVEVHHDRSLFQRGFQREVEFLAGQRGLRRKVWRHLALFQCGERRNHECCRQQTPQYQTFHRSAPSGLIIHAECPALTRTELRGNMRCPDGSAHQRR